MHFLGATMKNKAGCVSKYTTKSGCRLWRYRFDADQVDGKRRQMSQAGFATRAAAVKALGDAILEYARSKTLPAPPAPAPEAKETVADWLRTWLRDYAPQRCTPGTIQRYGQLAGYILDAKDAEPATLATTPLAQVDNAIVEAALYAMLRMPAKRRAHLSAKSIHDIAGFLSVTMTKAFKLGKIVVNPLLRVELPKVEPYEARALTLPEIEQLRAACRGDWTFVFVEVALATGCRRGELLALEWSDVDWLSNVLTVRKSLEETRAGLRIKCTKTARVRRFRIGPSVIAALRFQQEQQQERRRLCGADYKGDLIFCGPDGSFMWPHLVSQTIVRRMQKAGIKNASLHTTRHSHASILLSKGVPLVAVSARLGHANSNITLKTYAHMLPEDDARAADAYETMQGPVQ